MPLRPSATSNPIQAFPPDPGKCTTLTLTAGTATWTPAAGTKLYVFQPSTTVSMLLNTSTDAGTVGMSFDPAILAGPFAIHGATASITFTGTAGQTVKIWAD